MERLPAARSEGLIVESIEDELLVYDTERDRAHSLNPIAAAVWELSDGRRNAALLAVSAGAKLGEAVSEEAVWRALSQLDERGLLVGELPRRMSGPEYSRRQAVRRMGMIGASAAFAAPLVKSIVVPSAAQAQASCLPQGDICGTPMGGGCDTSTFPPCCPVFGGFCGQDFNGPQPRCICSAG